MLGLGRRGRRPLRGRGELALARSAACGGWGGSRVEGLGGVGGSGVGGEGTGECWWSWERGVGGGDVKIGGVVLVAVVLAVVLVLLVVVLVLVVVVLVMLCWWRPYADDDCCASAKRGKNSRGRTENVNQGDDGFALGEHSEVRSERRGHM